MIPDEAIEAALTVLRRDDLWELSDREEARLILEAAAPYMETTTTQEQTMTVEEAVQILTDAGVTGANYEAAQQAVQEIKK